MFIKPLSLLVKLQPELKKTIQTFKMNFIKSIFFMACVIAATGQFAAPELPFALPEGLPGAPTTAPAAESNDDSNNFEPMRQIAEDLRQMASESRRDYGDWEDRLRGNNE